MLRQMHVLSLLQDCLMFTGKIYLTMTDEKNCESDQEVYNNYKLQLSHFPLEIIHMELENNRIRCKAIGLRNQKEDEDIQTIIDEINNALEKLGENV